MSEPYEYEGQELEVFSHARNWKRYFRSRLRPFIVGEVLEVGAGIGTTTDVLREEQPAWTCLEPDPELAGRLETHVGTLPNSDAIRVRIGTTADLEVTELFDSIIYIDVLEHIEGDAAELEIAQKHVRPGGTIVVLSPAHQYLFTPFDKAIGHFRRYNRRSLKAVTPSAVDIETIHYLDSVGFAASLANRLLLRQSMPTVGQIKTWDRLMVPCSRVVDKILFHCFGKTIVGVWRKPTTGAR